MVSALFYYYIISNHEIKVMQNVNMNIGQVKSVHSNKDTFNGSSLMQNRTLSSD